VAAIASARIVGATLAVVSACAVATVTATATTHTVETCGHVRWPVKNMLDPGAGLVSLDALPTDIAHLESLARPAGVGATTPRLRPFEFRSYSITAPLIAARRLPSHDTVAVVGRPPDTMLVVFPDTHLCSDVGLGRHGGDIHSAGDGFNADCGPSIPSDHWQRLSGNADIAGVAFFDVRHANAIAGAAPNGLELHPVFSFWAPQCRHVPGRWPL
jgi:hypothetical protein